MKAVLRASRRVRGVAILAGFACAAVAQIAQNRPELCGAKAGAVPVPSGVTDAPGPSSFGSVLTITGPSSVRAEIPFRGRSVEQICPLAGNRLLAFGEMVPGAYYTGIIDLKTAKLVDGFESWWPPVISPDQRWLIMQAFYPAQSDAPFSDEYLLYDLTKDRDQNTMPNVTMYTEEMRGRVVYPAVDRGIPFEHFNLPANEMHVAGSTWYYWADDSSAVLFADWVEGTISVVLVRTDSEAPRAYVHAITPSDVCEQGSEGRIVSIDLMLSDAEVSPGERGRRVILAKFRSGDAGACQTKQAILREEDFKPAPLEIHPPIIRNRPVTVIKQPGKNE